MKTVIEQSKLEPSSDKRKQFDYIKFKVKEFCRKKSIELAKINKENMKSLEQKIKCAQERLQIDPTNIEIHQQLSDAQNSLDGHYQRIHKGLVLKSRTQYYEEGEKCTQFFLNSIKNNTNKTTIRQIKLNESSQIIDDPSLIMDELGSFYKTLYTSQREPEMYTFMEAETWIQDLKNRELIPQLSEDDIELLSKNLELEDLEAALKTTSPNKSPGNDGLPYEFYTHFWSEIKDPLFESLNEGLSEGELSTSQRQSTIRLIPKKDKDLLFIKNWRPLNQSNCDNKLLARVFAFLLLLVIDKLIHPSQVAYIRNRYIGEGIRTIEGIIEYLRENNLEGYLLSIDFEKAFDSLEWDYLWLVLEAFGFPLVFINKIKVMYKNIEACVLNDGTSTMYFTLSRCIKQGCPLSGLLFILAIELLLIRIRHEQTVQGIVVRNTEIKASAYADDVVNFL